MCRAALIADSANALLCLGGSLDVDPATIASVRCTIARLDDIIALSVAQAYERLGLTATALEIIQATR